MDNIEGPESKIDPKRSNADPFWVNVHPFRHPVDPWKRVDCPKRIRIHHCGVNSYRKRMISNPWRVNDHPRSMSNARKRVAPNEREACVFFSGDGGVAFGVGGVGGGS